MFRYDIERLAGLCELVGAPAVGKEPIVSNAVEPAWKRVGHKATHELTVKKPGLGLGSG